MPNHILKEKNNMIIIKRKNFINEKWWSQGYDGYTTLNQDRTNKWNTPRRKEVTGCLKNGKLVLPFFLTNSNPPLFSPYTLVTFSFEPKQMLLFLFFLFRPRQFGQPFLNLPYTLFAKRPPPPMLSALPPFPIAESFLSNQTLPLLKTKPILEAKIRPSSRQPLLNLSLKPF